MEPAEIVVHVSDVRHLFRAPDTDPLAEREGEITGEPALLRVVRRLMAAREMKGIHKLVVVVPQDAFRPDLEERTRQALSRYSRIKIEDNETQLRLMRRDAGRLWIRGILILLLCMGMSSLFNSETITFLPPLVSSTLGEGFNVIGWVMLWRPVEAFFFNPIPVQASTRVHRFLQTLRIEVRAAS